MNIKDNINEIILNNELKLIKNDDKKIKSKIKKYNKLLDIPTYILQENFKYDKLNNTKYIKSYLKNNIINNYDENNLLYKYQKKIQLILTPDNIILRQLFKINNLILVFDFNTVMRAQLFSNIKNILEKIDKIMILIYNIENFYFTKNIITQNNIQYYIKFNKVLFDIKKKYPLIKKYLDLPFIYEFVLLINSLFFINYL
jgi:hypothetical protein